MCEVTLLEISGKHFFDPNKNDTENMVLPNSGCRHLIMKSFIQLEVEAGKQKEGGRSKGTEINGIEALPTVRRPDIPTWVYNTMISLIYNPYEILK